jgi:hypothetical protein
MKKTFVRVIFLSSINVFAFGRQRIATAIPQKEQTVLNNRIWDGQKRYHQEEYDAISVNDLFFCSGSKSINVLSISPSKIKQLLGKPKKIEKGYSEMDNENTVTYIYPDGEIMFIGEQEYFYLELKGPGWSFGVRNRNGKISRFSPGDSLALLKKQFPQSCKHPISNVYMNVWIRTISGELSDSKLTFEVNKLKNKITTISLD